MIMIVSVYCPSTGKIPMFTKQRFVHALLLTVCCVSIAIGEPTVDGLPRTVWAGKLPGGPVKAVFLAPYAAQQDSFELVQRFDIEGTVVTMSSRLGPKAYDGLDVDGHYWPEFCPTREEVIEDIRGALSGEWEAVVMSRIPSWSTYPPDIRRSILEKVSSGRSLMIGVLDGALLEEVEAMGLELEESTIGAGRFPFSGHDRGTAGVYRCGKGFIAHFYAANNPVRGYLLSRSVLESDFEFSAARAGWLLRRLSRPDARSYLTGTRFADGSLVVELKAGAAPGAAVQIAIHRRDTYEKVLDAVAKAKPGKLVTARLPRVPGGEYQAHIRVTNRKGVTLDWDAIRFTVSGRVQFQALTVDRNEVKPGEKVSCRLDVAGETAGLETVVRWVDNWGRLLLETPPRPFSQDVEITAPGESLSVINRLEVTIHSDDGPEAVARAELLMPQNVEPADFYMVYWKLDQHHGAPPLSWGRRLQWDALRRRGAADSWANCAPVAGTARNAALCHLQTVPYTTSLHRIALYREDGSDSLLNAEWVANVEKNARKAARALRPYTPLAYTLGDENCVIWTPEGRFADTPGVWAAFRAYLRDVYPDLEALNAQWGTDFAAWDDIRFDSEQQMLPSMDNPSAWVDYRMLVTRHFADAHQRMRRAICEEDPGASVGWDGTTQFSTYDGIDWWEMCRDMGMVNTYHRTLTRHHRELFNGEAIGSFTRDARLRGCFLNGADRKYGGSYVPWYLLLKGWNSAWWWYATRPHPINGALRWDLDLTPIVEPMVAAVKEIKQGPGTLLAHARKDVSPIAVHYSATNWHASAIESGVGSRTANLGGDVALWMSTGLATRLFGDEEMARIWGGITPKGHCAAASANFYALLRDIGFEPRTMARQEIEAGALTQSGTRLLILPFVVSLSDLEAAKIREFMMGGGVLIADYRCGLRDEHGRLRETPALDDVFGIRRESLDVRRARGTLVADIAGGVQFESIFRDPVVADGARVRACHDDGTPALFMHHYAGGSTDSFGWYRLRVKTPAAFAGKRLYLVFGAVDEDTHLYINGTKVFEHS